MPSSIAWCAGFDPCWNLGANRLISPLISLTKYGFFLPKKDPSLTPKKKWSVHGDWSRVSLRCMIRPAFKRPWGKATSDVRHSDASFLRSGAPMFFCLNFIWWKNSTMNIQLKYLRATLMMACTYWSSLYWLNIAECIHSNFYMILHTNE